MEAENVAKMSPISAAEGSMDSGTKCAALENRSTMVEITVCLSEGGRLVAKSAAMCDTVGLAAG